MTAVAAIKVMKMFLSSYDKSATYGLILCQGQAFDRNFKQSNLYTFPFPPPPPLRIVKLDCLHAMNKLDHTASVFGCLVMSLVIQHCPFFDKKEYPTDIPA